jgi:hypothetical protein
LNKALLIIGILGAKRTRARSDRARKLEELRVGGLTVSICTSTTREQEDLVSCCPPVIEIQAPIDLNFVNIHFHRCSNRTYLSADDEGKAGLIVMFPSSDNVPLLTRTTIAVLDLDRDEVGPKISGERVNKETFAGGRLHQTTNISMGVLDTSVRGWNGWE